VVRGQHPLSVCHKQTNNSGHSLVMLALVMVVAFAIVTAAASVAVSAE